MKGFKVTLPNGTAKHGTDKIIYAVGQEYKMAEDAIICKKGFHFCTKPVDCFNYYEFNSSNLVFEVEALGNISTKVDGYSKVATNHLKVIRQIEWFEMLQLCNEGKDNTGLRNTGNSNTGYSNTGDRNTGGMNTGIANKGNRHTGAFCIGDANLTLFNNPTDMTYDEFISSKAYSLLCQVDTKKWVSSSEMTDEQKQLRPHHEVQGGMYIDVPFSVAFSETWETWTEKERGEFTKLPNFDADIFFDITGVKI